MNFGARAHVIQCLHTGDERMTQRGTNAAFHINIFFSSEDEGWIADIPDLEMCSAFGDSAAEALAEVEIAKAAWLDAARANGIPVPEPKYRPFIYQFGS
jgi:predicted RNase H-like HicB family nuclease